MNRRIGDWYSKPRAVDRFENANSSDKEAVMDDAAAVVSERNSQIPRGEAKTAQLTERLERLLWEPAEVEVKLSRADGLISRRPIVPWSG